MLAAVLAFAAPAILLTACNDDPLFEVPVEPPTAPTAVSASAVGNDVTVTWTPGVGATSQEVRLSPVVAVPASAGNALQADDIVQVIEDGTTSTWTFTNVPDGAYQATVTAINSGGRVTSAADAVVVGGGGGDAPEITSFEAVDGALVVEWTAIATAEAYHVTLTDGDGTVLEEEANLSTSPTSYTFTVTPEAGVTYTVEVCAVFDLGATEDCGATADYTYEGPGTTPEITSFTEVEGALVVEWTAIATAEAYHVTLTETDGGDVIEEIVDLSTSPTSYTFTEALEAGTSYTVEVCAVFNQGATEDCGATVEYTTNSLPTVEITAPANESTFFNTELITFTGTGTDAEDGALTGESLAWSSDVDGAIATGDTLVLDASLVSLGAHVITLTATDSQGATGEASINITINQASSVISFPALIQSHLTTQGCTGCHGGTTPTQGISLDSWEGIVRGEAPDGDPLIVIGDAADPSAALLPVLGVSHMGVAATEPGIIASFEQWINDGAPSN
jgi:hypothetical protein